MVRSRDAPCNHKIMHLLVLLSAFLFTSSVTHALFHQKSHDTHNYYVLRHDPTYAPLADVADLLEIEIVEPVGELEDFWLARTEIGTTSKGDMDDPVLVAFQQMRRGSLLSWRGGDISRALKHLSRQIPFELTRRAPPPVKRQFSYDDPKAVAIRLGIKDPLFPLQWSLVNEDHPSASLNVARAWELGYTGKGHIVSVIDDGIMYDHEDLKDKFVAKYSYNFVDNKRLPGPVDKTDNHGTACAGVIVSAKNNVCGIGIAYDSLVAGIRVISSRITYDDEAKAFTFGHKDVSVYTCSFGPVDDGKSLGGPAYVVKQALLKGVTDGRKGKGSIYVFAAGNGGGKHDECNYDGYANSIYTIAIGSLDHTGNHAPYSEGCAALMAVTFGSSAEKGIATLDTQDTKSCRTDFGTTSSSAPSAAGIFLLALEARPELTWRDIQYLCVETAQVVNPNDVSWDALASGRKFSHKFGFGVLDAYKFVQAAQKWKLVTPQTWIKAPLVRFDNGAMDANGKFSGGTALSKKVTTRNIVITEKMAKDANFGTIEHIQVKVWAEHDKRGDIEVLLVKQSVWSELGTRRIRDNARTGLRGWTFSTLKHWGESPVGTWSIAVSDQGSGLNKGAIIGAAITFWGCTKNSSTTPGPYELPPDDNNVFPPSEW